MPNVHVQVANKSRVQVSLIGTVRLNLVDDAGKPYTMLLRNVHYSPEFSNSLLSVDEMYKQHRIKTVFGGENHMLLPSGEKIPLQQDGTRNFQLHAYAMVSANARVWHRRFMHVSAGALRRLGHIISDLSAVKDGDFSDCDARLQGAARKIPTFVQPRRPRRYNTFGKTTEFTHFGQRIASDLCGPFPDGNHGEIYAIVFHDSYTKYISVYTIPDKTKETVLEAFQQFITDHSDKLSQGIGHFWTDNGGEYLNKDMEAFCEEICVKRNFTVPYKPDQNPYAERAWGTVLRKVRTSLHDSGLSESFWPDFIQHAALIHNILPNANGNTPYEMVHGKQYDYQRLRRPVEWPRPTHT